MTDTEDTATVQCIRCDRQLPKSLDLADREYVSLTYNQETGALPICRDCFEEVQPRDLIN
jgi:hypothetical protein